jgi:hypothetical protein
VDLSDFVIVVVRYGRDGTLRNSAPCSHCLEMLKKYQIKRIIYSTDDNLVVSCRPCDMETPHISSGWNAFHTRFK